MTNGYLAHYGVKGQKWGVRNWQNADGTYTDAGRQRYWGGGQRQITPANAALPAARRSITRSNTPIQRSQVAKPTTMARKPTAEEMEARRQRTRRVIAIAAGVTLTAALAYGAYRGSTNLRNKARRDMLRTAEGGLPSTLNSKYWTSKDRHEYAARSRQLAESRASRITRRDAIAEKFGVRSPKSRSRVLAERSETNRFANFIRDAESRGAMNRKISDLRKDIREQERRLTTYSTWRDNAPKYDGWNDVHPDFTRKYQSQIEDSRKRLQGLLAQRRSW